MDGNRRFAESHLGTRDAAEGHAAGYAALLSALEWCLDLGVRTVSVFAFSVDNFSRPQREVDALMELAREKLGELAGNGSRGKASEEEGGGATAAAAAATATKRETKTETEEEDGGQLLQRHGVQLRVLGELSRLPPAVAEAARAAEKATENGNKARLNVCLAYSSTREIAEAISRISKGENDNSSSFAAASSSPAHATAAGHDAAPGSPTTPLVVAGAESLREVTATPSPSLSPAPVEERGETETAETTSTFSSSSFSSSPYPCGLIDRALYTAGCPPVDLLLRTSGESRLSDFLLWQSRHAALVFAPRLWPELRFLDVARAVVAFQRASPKLGELQRAAEEAGKAAVSRADDGAAAAAAASPAGAAPPAAAPAAPAAGAGAPAPSRGGGSGVPRRVRGSRSSGNAGVRAQAFPPSMSSEGEAAAAAREAPAPSGENGGDNRDKANDEKDDPKNVLAWASRSTWRTKRRGDAEIEDEEGGGGGPDDHGFDPHCPCCLTTGGRLIDGAADEPRNLVMPSGLEEAMLLKKKREAEVRAAMAAARAEKERRAKEEEEGEAGK